MTLADADAGGLDQVGGIQSGKGGRPGRNPEAMVGLNRLGVMAPIQADALHTQKPFFGTSTTIAP